MNDKILNKMLQNIGSKLGYSECRIIGAALVEMNLNYEGKEEYFLKRYGKELEECFEDVLYDGHTLEI